VEWYGVVSPVCACASPVCVWVCGSPHRLGVDPVKVSPGVTEGSLAVVRPIVEPEYGRVWVCSMACGSRGRG